MKQQARGASAMEKLSVEEAREWLDERLIVHEVSDDKREEIKERMKEEMFDGETLLSSSEKELREKLKVPMGPARKLISDIKEFEEQLDVPGGPVQKVVSDVENVPWKSFNPSKGVNNWKWWRPWAVSSDQNVAEELEDMISESENETADNIPDKAWNSATDLSIADVIQLVQKGEATLQQVDGKDVVMLVGATGVGKSMFLHYMAQSKIEQKGHELAVKKVRRALQACKVSSRANSVTASMFGWQLESHPSVLLVDCPGFHDTRSPAINVATSILTSKLAARCNSLRLVFFVDIQLLLNATMRGGHMREVVDLVIKSVPTCDEHLGAMTFLFTKPVEGTDLKCIAKQMEDIEKNTGNEQMKNILKRITKDLRADRPALTGIFHPLKCDRGKMLSLIVPDLVESEEGSMRLTCAGEQLKCGMTRDMENLLKRSLSDFEKNLEHCIEGTTLDAERAKAMVEALRYLKDTTKMECVKEAWTEALKVISELITRAEHDLRSRIDGAVRADVPPMTPASVSSLMELLQRLDCLCGLGDGSTAAEDMRHFLRLRLETLLSSISHLRAELLEPVGFGGWHETLQSLRAWSCFEKRFYEEAVQEMESLVQNIIVMSPTDAGGRLQARAIMRQLITELERCDQECLKKLLPAVIEAERLTGDALDKNIMDCEKNVNTYVELVSKGNRLSDMKEFGHELHHLEEVLQAARKYGHRDFADCTTRIQETVQKKISLALGHALGRINVWGNSNWQSSLLLEADVLNAFRMHAYCNQIGCVAANTCEDIVRKALSSWDELKQTLEVKVSKMERAAPPGEADATGLATIIKTAASLLWFDELTGDMVCNTRLQVVDTVAKHHRKLLEYFEEKGDRIIQEIARFLSKGVDCKDMAFGQALESNVASFKLVEHFHGINLPQPRYENCQTWEAQIDFSKKLSLDPKASYCPTGKTWKLSCKDDLAELQARVVHDVKTKMLDFLDNLKTERLAWADMQACLAFPKLHWEAVPTDFFEKQEQLRTSLQHENEEVRKLFSKEGNYGAKRRAVDQILECQGYPAVAACMRPVDGHGGLLQSLRQEVQDIIFHGRELCDVASSDWEATAQTQSQFLGSIHHEFQSCHMAESFTELAIRFKQDLDNKIDLKRNDIEQSIIEAIDHLKFDTLHDILSKPPSSVEGRRRFDSNMQRINRAIVTRLESERSMAQDANKLVELFSLLQKADRDVGKLLLEHDIDLSAKVQEIQGMMSKGLGALLTKLQEDLCSETYDFGVVLQQLAAARNFYKTCETSFREKLDQMKHLETVEQGVAKEIESVRKMIDVFAEESVSRERCGEVASKLRKILSAVKAHPDQVTSDPYRNWIERLSSKLTDTHQKQQTKFHAKQQSAFELADFYQYMQGEWQDWLSDHLQHRKMPDFKLQCDTMRREVKEEQKSVLLLFDSDEDLLRVQSCFELKSRQSRRAYKYYQGYVCGELENCLRQAEQRLKLHDLLGAISQYVAPHRYLVLKAHLTHTVANSIVQFQERFWAAGESLCEQLCKDVSSGNISARTSSSLRTLGEYARFVCPFLPSPRVYEACTRLHCAVVDRVEADQKKLSMQCSSSIDGIDGIGRSLEDIRYAAGALTGWFAVYAEDVQKSMDKQKHPLAEASLSSAIQAAETSLGSAVHALQKAFTDARGMWEVARSIARLELEAKGNHNQVNIKQASGAMEKKYNPDSCTGVHGGHHPVLQPCMTNVLRQVRLAAECLVNDRVERWSGHLDELYSHLVLEVFDKQMEDAKSLLDRGLYEEVQTIFASNQKWHALRHLVRPPLDVDGLQCRLQAAIADHANALSGKAKSQFNDHQYRLLDRSLGALHQIDVHFGAGIAKEAKAIIDQMRESIMLYIESQASSARASLANRGNENAHVHSFANDLIHLGLVWCEVTAYQKHAYRKIKELLDFCWNNKDELGVPFLRLLGGALINIKDDKQTDEDDEDDEQTNSGGTMSHMTVAQRIIDEFRVFRAYKTALFKKAVEKMQMAPDECVDRMMSKSIVDEVDMDIDKEDLKDGLKQFMKYYEDLFKRFLDKKLVLEDMIVGACDKAAACKAQMGNRENADISSVKQHIPELLACIFMHYTAVSAGEDEIVEDTKDGLKTPHNIQVLAVLKMVGYGGKTSHGLANQLLKVRTGEGKSLILGSSATLFAMLGFRVRCVCYSSYLSSRDFQEFSQTFEDFRVKEFVKYSQISTYSEDLVARQGDIRSLTAKLLGQTSVEPCSGAASLQTGTCEDSLAHMPEVLLVDEVDVLFGEAFYGRTYDQMAMLENQNVRAILEALWARRFEAKTNLIGLLRDVETWTTYQSLLSSFKGFEYVIDAQVKVMCADLRGFMEGAQPVPHFDPSHGGRIGYKSLDGIEFGVVHGYRTAYAYLDHKDKLKDWSKTLQHNLALLVPCGQFSYARITPAYVFGVSGTVDKLETYQRKSVAKHNLHAYTILPSLYGDSQGQFLEKSGAVKICDASDFHQQIALAIMDILHENRAIIVFFRDALALRGFRSSTYCKGKIVEACDVLEEHLTNEQKDRLIKKAATRGQVTFSTAIFGRGSDFACYDENLNLKGGMHVLQTFVSLDISEEVQIRGRTARQGKKGSYSMILREDELQKELNFDKCILNNGQGDCYSTMRERCCSVQDAKFQKMEADLQVATCRDELTRKYFNCLRANKQDAAADCFKQVFTDCMGVQDVPANSVFHYIICLDRSGSMGGSKFELAQQGAVNFVTTASKLNAGTASSVSLIMFDDGASIECRELPLTDTATFRNCVTYTGGGTDFEQPLSHAADLIRQTSPKYDRQCILFYTDGEAAYPSHAVALLSGLRKSNPNGIDFFAIAENDATILVQICNNLYPESGKEHCLSRVSPEQIAGKMQEVLQSMNAGFVRRPE